MPKNFANSARQSDPERNPNFGRRWIETEWPIDDAPARLCGQRVVPTDAMVQHSADRSRHVLTGRALEGGR